MASTGLSSLGDELALIALTIKVAELTDSGWAVSGLLVAGLAPLVIFAPAAGVIVDNFETRRSLVIASGIQAGLAVWLAFAGGLPAILLLSFLLGTCTAVASPAIYTLAPVVVGEEHATEGNAYLETARYVGMISGPVLAGSLSFGAGSRIALLVDAGTFAVVAIAAAALVARREPAGIRGRCRRGQGRVRHRPSRPHVADRVRVDRVHRDVRGHGQRGGGVLRDRHPARGLMGVRGVGIRLGRRHGGRLVPDREAVAAPHG